MKNQSKNSIGNLAKSKEDISVGSSTNSSENKFRTASQLNDSTDNNELTILEDKSEENNGMNENKNKSKNKKKWIYTNDYGQLIIFGLRGGDIGGAIAFGILGLFFIALLLLLGYTLVQFLHMIFY